MTKYELLKTNQGVLDLIVKNGIKPTDIKHLPLYEKYRKMRDEGNKMIVIFNELSQMSGLKERALYDMIRRFETTLVL